jgi:lipoate-protein ligase A
MFAFGDAIRLIHLGPMNWLRTQSVLRSTAALLEDSSPDTLIMAIPVHPYIAVGQGRSPETVVDLTKCAAQNIPVVAAPLSRPLMFYGTHSLIFQWVFHPADGDQLAGQIAQGVISGLGSLGLAGLKAEDGNVLIGDKCLVEISTGKIEQAMIGQGCLHMNLDRALVSALGLNIPATTLWRESPRPLPPDAVHEALLAGFEGALGRSIKRGTPQQTETRLSKQIDLELLEQATQILGTQIVFGAH